MARIREVASQAGRDPSAIRLAFSTTVLLDPGASRAGSDGRRPFHGGPEDIRADLQRYEDVGVERFILNFGAAPPAEYERRLRQFVEQVQPALTA
jgi:alkanesulfonate monooxygenase SsuD/methylene tetrahydromethanopterin reductase-like flavin-dependent oxidoreductase (luciferase family)